MEEIKTINFIAAPSYINLVQRVISEDNKIEIGVLPVIYGFRVRAGYVGAGGCEIDWCCGNLQSMVELGYFVCKKLLSQGCSFSDMPSSSRIKPFYKDMPFIEWLFSKLDDSDVIEPLTSIWRLRNEWWHIRTIQGI